MVYLVHTTMQYTTRSQRYDYPLAYDTDATKIPKQGQSIVKVRGGSRAWTWVNKVWSIFQIKTTNHTYIKMPKKT